MTVPTELSPVLDCILNSQVSRSFELNGPHIASEYQAVAAHALHCSCKLGSDQIEYNRNHIQILFKKSSPAAWQQLVCMTAQSAHLQSTCSPPAMPAEPP